MNDQPASDDDREPIDLLVEEFVARRRRGESPTIEEYAERYPALAEEIRALFPAATLLERQRAASDSTPSPDTVADARSPLVPTRIGPYQVVREIGRGGMGIVYEAFHEALRRRVAVKVLPHAFQSSSAALRFQRETQALARLRHPNIVAIHDAGSHEGSPYYVMDLIDGPSLDRALADAVIAPPVGTPARAHWAANLGLQAARALAFVHEMAILHRDIKPSNLLLDRGGTLYLSDLGLAKLPDNDSLTASQDVPGTLRYLPPECLFEGAADPRSDIYGLGLTLYELATAQPAFPGSNRGRLILDIDRHAIEPPRRLVPTLPPDLETIMRVAHARDPAHRYPTAQALADDLERFLDGRPIRAQRAHLGKRALMAARRNPVVAVLAALSFLFGTLTLVLGLMAWYAPPPPPRERPPFRKGQAPFPFVVPRVRPPPRPGESRLQLSPPPARGRFSREMPGPSRSWAHP